MPPLRGFSCALPALNAIETPDSLPFASLGIAGRTNASVPTRAFSYSALRRTNFLVAVRPS